MQQGVQVVRYLGPMPVGSEMPFFTGLNITEFLERYEIQCTEYAVYGNAVVEKLPQYCELTIRMYIRTIPEWRIRDWDGLKVVLLEEYRQDDSYQQMMTLGFLEALRDKGCTAGTTVRIYCRQFDHISTTLVDKGLLNTYSQSVWFLKGLPAAVREKVVRKHGINLDKPETLQFRALLRSVQSQYTAERTNELLAERTGMKETWSEIVDQIQTKTPVIKEDRLAPPTRTIYNQQSQGPSSQQSRTDTRMDELAKQMESLVLAQRMAFQGGYAAGNPNVRIGGSQFRTQQSVVPLATVNTQRPAQEFTGCYYCGGEHSEWSCQLKQTDLAEGVIHVNNERKICLGKTPGTGQPSATPIRFKWNEPKRPQILAQSGTTINNENREMERTKVLSLRLGLDADYSDDEAVLERVGDSFMYSDDSDVELVGIGAARIDISSKGNMSNKFTKDAHRVLKSKAEKEKRMPSAKHVKTGNWKPVEIAKVKD